MSHWRVVQHAPFGLVVEDVEAPAAPPAVVDLVFMPDEARGRSMADFPPIGSIVEAAIEGRTPDGQLRLSMLAADIEREHG